ncbi:CNNM domain-containing protein [Thermostilla marina]
MTLLIHSAPWLAAMAALIAASGFFSAGEAAMFYLGYRDRREMAEGTACERLAIRLLDDSDRLLSAILFWNLTVNVVYFSLSSILALNWESQGYSAAAGALAAASLGGLIFFSELLPKTLAVLRPRFLARTLAIPLAWAVRAVDPILPTLRKIAVLIERVIWPRFQPEPYLRLRDLEQAVIWSETNAAQLEQEQVVLQNLVHLSELRAEEVMQPRPSLVVHTLPDSVEAIFSGEYDAAAWSAWLQKLRKSLAPDADFAMLADPHSEEVTAYIPSESLISGTNLSPAEAVIPIRYVPWCVEAAKVLDELREAGAPVCAVVNEHGETIGIVSQEDLMRTVFSSWGGRSDWLLRRRAIRVVGPGVWHVDGLTNLRRLARYFGIEKPASVSVTVAGLIQERLERLPAVGDECEWGPLHFRVLEVSPRGVPLVEVRRPVPRPGKEGAE